MAADQGRCDPSLVGQVTGELLRKTVTMMTKLPEEESHDPATLQQLQNHAVATAKVILKAGQKVLAKKDVADLVQVLVQILGRVKVTQDTAGHLSFSIAYSFRDVHEAEMAPKAKSNAKNKVKNSRFWAISVENRSKTMRNGVF